MEVIKKKRYLIIVVVCQLFSFVNKHNYNSLHIHQFPIWKKKTTKYFGEGLVTVQNSYQDSLKQN